MDTRDGRPLGVLCYALQVHPASQKTNATDVLNVSKCSASDDPCLVSVCHKLNSLHQALQKNMKGLTLDSQTDNCALCIRHHS